jgi:hypothetical protein
MEGSPQRDLSISLAAANLYGVVAPLPLILPLIWLFLTLHGWVVPRLSLWIWLVLIVAGVFAHELLHGLVWALVARRPFSAVKFGFMVKTLTPYTHLKEPAGIGPYRLGLLAPLVILGLLPGLASILVGSADLFLFGALFIFAAGGDILVFWLIRRLPPGSLIEDHPSRAGCLVIDKP